MKTAISSLLHTRHCPAGFKGSYTVTLQRLWDQDVEDIIVKSEFSKYLPFNDVAPFRESSWDSFFEQKRFVDPSEDEVIHSVETFRISLLTKTR